jgi:hypothetical protein
VHGPAYGARSAAGQLTALGPDHAGHGAPAQGGPGNDEGPSTHELEGPRRSRAADRRSLGARRHRTVRRTRSSTDRSAGRAVRRACRPLSVRLLGRCAAPRRHVVRFPSDRSAGALHHAGASPASRPIARPARSVAPRDPSASRPIARSVRLEPPCPVRSPSDCSAGAPPGTCASSDASRSLGRSPRGTPRGPGRRSLAGPDLGTRPRCPVTRRKPWFPAASDVPESPPGRSPLPVT